MNNKPTLFGLTAALTTAQDLFEAANKADLEAYTAAKESVRKAKENLRVFSYKQKGHLTAKGTVLRV
jgi:hypothetical protein